MLLGVLDSPAASLKDVPGLCGGPQEDPIMTSPLLHTAKLLLLVQNLDLQAPGEQTPALRRLHTETQIVQMPSVFLVH